MFKQKTAYELRISDWSSDGCSSDLFTLFGTPCVGLNGPPIFKHSEAFSFMVQTVTQEETDRLWNAIVDKGGPESVCGWCKDKWGVSWQITPRVLLDATTGRDREDAKRAFEEMMTNKKDRKSKRLNYCTYDATRKPSMTRKKQK